MENIIYNRIKDLCESNGISINHLENTLNIGSSTISRWKASSPSTDKVLKVAQYFNVTTDYLIGVSDNSTTTSTTNALFVFQEPDKTITKKLLSLSERNKYKIDGQIDIYLAEEKREATYEQSQPITISIKEPKTMETTEEETVDIQLIAYGGEGEIIKAPKHVVDRIVAEIEAERLISRSVIEAEVIRELEADVKKNKKKNR